MYAYPLVIHREASGVWLSSPDLPEMNGSGDDLSEARADALNGMESTFSLYVDQRRKIPLASDVQGAELVLDLPVLTVAKIMLWNAMLEQGVSRQELAGRLGCSRQAVDRLVDFLHASKIEQVERALGALNCRLALILQPQSNAA